MRRRYSVYKVQIFNNGTWEDWSTCISEHGAKTKRAIAMVALMDNGKPENTASKMVRVIAITDLPIQLYSV